MIDRVMFSTCQYSTDLLRGVLQGTEILIILLQYFQWLVGRFLSFWVPFTIWVLLKAQIIFFCCYFCMSRQFSAFSQLYECRMALISQMLNALILVGRWPPQRPCVHLNKHFLRLNMTPQTISWRRLGRAGLTEQSFTSIGFILFDRFNRWKQNCFTCLLWWHKSSAMSHAHICLVNNR